MYGRNGPLHTEYPREYYVHICRAKGSKQQSSRGKLESCDGNGSAFMGGNQNENGMYAAGYFSVQGVRALALHDQDNAPTTPV